MKRLTKEYSLKINEYIDVKYGSVNRENPIVVYIEGKTWICPKHTSGYVESINEIMKKFERELKSKVKNDVLFDDRLIFDFDVKAASLRENKKSFMSFDIFVKQMDKKLKNLKELKYHLMDEYKCIFDNLTFDLYNHTFSLSKTKH